MSSRLKSLLKIAAIITAVVFLLNLLVDNPVAHQIARSFINKNLAEKVPFKVEFQAIEVSAIPPGVDLFGFAISHPDKQEASLANAARVKARISLWSMMMGEPALGLLEMNELKMQWPLPAWAEAALFSDDPPDSTDDDGEPTQISWPPDFQLPIEQVVLRNSNLFLTLEGDTPDEPLLNLSMQGTNLDFRFSNWEDMSVQFDIRSTDVYLWNQHVIQGGTLLGTLEMESGDMLMEDLELVSRDLNAEGTLAVALKKTRQLADSLRAPRLTRESLDSMDLEAKLKVSNSDLAVLGRFLDIEDTKGVVAGDVNIRVKVPFTDPENTDWWVTGQGGTNNGQIYGFKLFDSEAAFKITEEQISFREILFNRNGRSMGRSKGHILFNDEVSYKFSISPEKMPLKDLLEAVQVEEFEAVSTDLIGKNVSLIGQGFPFRLSVKGPAWLKDLDIPPIPVGKSRFREQPSCLVNLNLRADKERLTFANIPGVCLLPGEQGLKRPPPLLDGKGGDLPAGTARSPLTLSGHTTFDAEAGMDLRIDFSQLQLPLVRAWVQQDMSGEAATLLRIHGPYARLSLDTDVRGQPVTIAGMALGHLEARTRLDFQKNQLHFGQFRSRPDSGGVLQADGMSIELSEHLPFQGHLKGSGLKEEFFSTFFDYWSPETAISFTLPTVDLRLKGHTFTPATWMGDYQFRLENFRLNDQLLVSSVNGHIVNNEKFMSTKNLGAVLGDLVTKVDIRIDKSPAKTKPGRLAEWAPVIGLHGEDKVRAKITTVQRKSPSAVAAHRNHLGLLPWAGPVFRKMNTGGKIIINGELDGDLRRLQGKFDGKIYSLSVFGSRVASVQFSGFVEGSQVDIPIIKHGGQALVGRFSVDFLHPDLPYHWYFQMKGFDLRALPGVWFSEDPRNYLYLTSHWSMKGHFREFWHSTGELHLERLKMRYVQESAFGIRNFDLHNRNPVTLLMQESGWNFKDEKDLILTGNEINLVVNVKDNDPPSRLNISLDGSARAAILKHFLKVVESAKGEFLLAGRLSGSVTDPDLEFSVQDKKPDALEGSKWEPVSVSIVDIPPAFTNIKLDVSYQNGRIDIHQLIARKGKEGKVSVTGQFFPFAADPDTSSIAFHLDNIEIRRYPIAIFKNMDSVLSGDLTLTGNRLPLTLTGLVNIDKAQSVGDFDIRQQILDSIYKRKFKINPVPRDPLVNFDVRIQGNESVRIRNRNFRAVVTTNAKLVGNNELPMMLGEIQIPSGKFFYKREFTVQRGYLFFDAPISPPDPQLDIIGEAKVSQYTVRVVVSGYASDPRVELIADPPTRPDGTPLTKVDILLLLTRGKISDSQKTFGNTSAIAKAEALNLAISQFEQPIEKLFDMSGQTVIREIYLDAYLPENSDESETQTPAARLNLPIRLSDDISLIIQADDQSNMKVSSEYAVHEGISLTGSVEKRKEDADDQQDVETDTGVDLKFRFSFP